MSEVASDTSVFKKNQVETEEMNLNVCHSNFQQDPVIVKNKTRSASKQEKVQCAAIIAIAMLAALACACIIAAYVEIFRLKLEVASLQNISSQSQNTTNKTITSVTSSLKSEIASLQQSTRSMISGNQNSTDVKLSLSNDQYFASISMLNNSLSQSITTLETKTEQLGNTTQERLTNLENILLGRYSTYPAPSCAEVLLLTPSSPSGYYWVRSSSGSAVRVYCDMTRTCGGITGGWMRVVELELTDNTAQCPSSLALNTNPRRTCRINSNSASCSGDMLSVYGIKYSRVCGKIIAYQFGSPDAFGSTAGTLNPGIETYYVDGISLTHGSPRQHIWTFVGALDETNLRPDTICHCTNIAVQNGIPNPPNFVMNDYFCDTAASNEFTNIFYADDPLWDGAGCGPQNTCCSFNNPPWFYKQLPQPTTDDIEMRVCRDQARTNEDIEIEAIDIYVH